MLSSGSRDQPVRTGAARSPSCRQASRRIGGDTPARPRHLARGLSRRSSAPRRSTTCWSSSYRSGPWRRTSPCAACIMRSSGGRGDPSAMSRGKLVPPASAPSCTSSTCCRRCHGRGIGARALRWVEDAARARGLSCIRLRVNRRNSPAIRAYVRAGFSFEPRSCTDIGGGFVMDDFVMAKPAHFSREAVHERTPASPTSWTTTSGTGMTVCVGPVTLQNLEHARRVLSWHRCRAVTLAQLVIRAP